MSLEVWLERAHKDFTHRNILGKSVGKSSLPRPCKIWEVRLILRYSIKRCVKRLA